MSAPLQIGLLMFPRVTQLDFTGPLQVFSSLPGAQLHLIWKRIEPVPSNSVLTLTPTMTFADCPQLDVICVPGGRGTETCSTTKMCSISCAGRPRAPNTSLRSALDRWCWALPDC